MTADSMLAEVLDLSRLVHRASNGAFDPTVGPLVELWGFGTHGEQSAPDSVAVAAALARVGLDKCHIAGGRIEMDSDSMRLDTTHDRLMVVELRDAAMATSGNYRNYRNMPDGKRIGHTISAVTGYPVVTSTLSVTVVASECALADAIATAAMAMPYPEARAMVDSMPDVEALFVIDSPEGMQTITTDGFPAPAI